MGIGGWYDPPAPTADTEEVLEFDNQAAFPATGVGSVLYVAKDTSMTYRWNGTAYTATPPGVSPTDERLTNARTPVEPTNVKTTPADTDKLSLFDTAYKYLTWANLKTVLKTYFDGIYPALGTSSTTACRGDYGTAAYNHSQATGNAHNLPNATESASGLMSAAQVTALAGKLSSVAEANLSLSDNTTADASTAKHGFLKKLSNIVSDVMRGDGTWGTPTKLANARSGGSDLQLWSGTQAQYDALSPDYDANTLYHIIPS